jgi:glycine cleavage system regulatory protein
MTDFHNRRILASRAANGYQTAMQMPLVMTIIGPDRPGLVESVARAVAGHDGNWLESRMSRLGGEFAGILRIEVPTEKRQSLLDSLKNLQNDGLTVVVHVDKSAVTTITSGRAAKLEVVGHDRPGIVREISSALARAGVNVEEFSSEVVSAPMSGEVLFKASVHLQLPDSCNLTSLKRELEKIASDLLVDVSFVELGN